MTEINTNDEKYDSIKLAALSRYELIKEIRSLLTTIESQKEEIEKAVAEIKFQVERNDKQREEYFRTEALYLSQKAITELAVKGLKEIACLNVDSAYSAGTIARTTFSEIEKLSNPLRQT